MTLSLSPRDRRVLLLGAAAVALIFVLGRGVPAWRAWTAEARASAAEMTVEAARAEAAADRLAETLDSLEARRDRLVELAPALLDGDTPAAAAGSLASLLSGAAAREGVRLDAVRLHPDTARAGVFVPVAVEAEGVADVRGLTRMLAALEGGPARVAVTRLAVDQAEPAAPPDRPETLRIRLRVEGISLAARSSSDAAPVADGSAADEPEASP